MCLRGLLCFLCPSFPLDARTFSNAVEVESGGGGGGKARGENSESGIDINWVTLPTKYRGGAADDDKTGTKRRIRAGRPSFLFNGSTASLGCSKGRTATGMAAVEEAVV